MDPRGTRSERQGKRRWAINALWQGILFIYSVYPPLRTTNMKLPKGPFLRRRALYLMAWSPLSSNHTHSRTFSKTHAYASHLKTFPRTCTTPVSSDLNWLRQSLCPSFGIASRCFTHFYTCHFSSCLECVILLPHFCKFYSHFKARSYWAFSMRPALITTAHIGWLLLLVFSWVLVVLLVSSSYKGMAPASKTSL